MWKFKKKKNHGVTRVSLRFCKEGMGFRRFTKSTEHDTQTNDRRNERQELWSLKGARELKNFKLPFLCGWQGGRPRRRGQRETGRPPTREGKQEEESETSPHLLRVVPLFVGSPPLSQGAVSCGTLPFQPAFLRHLLPSGETVCKSKICAKRHSTVPAKPATRLPPPRGGEIFPYRCEWPKIGVFGPESGWKNDATLISERFTAVVLCFFLKTSLAHGFPFAFLCVSW